MDVVIIFLQAVKLFSAVIAGVSLENTPPNQDVTVSTECGNVVSFTKDEAYSFRGIPYASPPVGDLRWRPPQKLALEAGNCWKSDFQARNYGNTCFSNQSWYGFMAEVSRRPVETGPCTVPQRN